MKKKLLAAVLVTCGLMVLAGCEPNVVDNNNTGTTTTENGMTSEGDITSDTGGTGATDNTDGTDDTDAASRGAVGHRILSVSSGAPRSIFTGTEEAKRADSAHLPNKKIGWGLGKTTDDQNRPTDAVAAQEKYSAYGAEFIGAGENTIYLTFDEGYENGYTAQILDILKEKQVKATFFVTYDYCKSAGDLVARMIDEGHTVGSHTYTHPSLPDCSASEVRDEIMSLHRYVKENFGYTMRLIRFPMGEFSERTLALAQECGYTSVFWSYAHVDWDVKNQPPVPETLDKMKTATHPGAIVLLHAVSRTNTELLGDILDYWANEGYTLAVWE